MARPLRGHPTYKPQQEGEEELDRVPQQEDQLDATEGKNIADCNPDVDYESSEPEVEPITQVEREVDPDAEDANMDIPHDGTLHQRMMPWEQYKGILWVHRAQGPEIMALKLQDMYTLLGYSPEAAKLDSPDRLRVLTDKNVDDICNVVRKPGGKNADGTPDRGQQVSVIAQENLKLAAFLFHHRWRCTFDWEIMGVNEGILHFLAGQEKLKDDNKDPDVLPKFNKSDMAGMMESIGEYF